MFDCPVCCKDTVYAKSIRNMHVTGDVKKFRLQKCSECGRYYLFIDVDAHLSYGVNYLEYRIGLDDEEAKEIEEIMASCPEPGNEDCTCPAHKIMDRFEMINAGRRVTITDDMEEW